MLKKSLIAAALIAVCLATILIAEDESAKKASARNPEELIPAPNELRVIEGAVLLGCRISKNDKSPGMNEFSRRTQGWAGFSEGVNEAHFIFKSDVKVKECDEALWRAGCRPRRSFPYEQALKKMKSGKIDVSHYLDGTPVLIGVRWKEEGRIRELPFERFFTERVEIGGEAVEKPFTPHWVYHGSGLLNKKLYGCFICQQDCSGGLICDNRYPCVKPVPELKPDWRLLPEPETNAALVIYVLNER